MGEISRLLESMGAIPDEVAATVRTAKVQGLIESSSFLNPIVRYLNRSLNIGGRLEIGAAGMHLRMQYGGTFYEVCLPPAAQEFLDRFHACRYPDPQRV
jgi:hypothetical protein